MKVFCFPYAGGSSQVYSKWIVHKQFPFEIVPIEIPGRGRLYDVTPRADIHSLIEFLADHLIRQLVDSYSFFGHSMGAILAFELIRYFEQHNIRTPKHLFVSGAKAPNQFSQNKKQRRNLPVHLLKEELVNLGGTPKEVLDNEDLLSLFLPIIRADFSVCETYSYKTGKPINCPITVFGGDKDNEASPMALDSWAEFTKSSFAKFMFQGDHFYIHNNYEKMLNIMESRINNEL